ncbi:hypothetical protein GCM10027085_48970 [Spirosoma aerophilum]
MNPAYGTYGYLLGFIEGEAGNEEKRKAVGWLSGRALYGTDWATAAVDGSRRSGCSEETDGCVRL